MRPDDRKYRVVSDGTTVGTKVFGPNNEEVLGVGGVYFYAHEGKVLAEVRLNLTNVAVELSGVRPLRDLPLIKRAEEYFRLNGVQQSVPEMICNGGFKGEEVDALAMVGVAERRADMVIWKLPLDRGGPSRDPTDRASR